ncbi:MAG: aminoglycoside phosphotransferase family protein [Polyangiaceae bacterium]|nr:aminoglycoside phosphotransferase family protein [Polyangiaceae bacterium]
MGIEAGWPVDRDELVRFLARWSGAPVRAPRLSVRALPGGLSSLVLLVSARWTGGRGRAQQASFVLKILEGDAAREADIYALLSGSGPGAAGLCPRLLHAERSGSGRFFLYLEQVSPVHTWPWRDTGHAGRVLERLARFHASLPGPGALPSWDYESELRASAAETLALAAGLPRSLRFPALSRSLPALRRMVSALPELRRQLLDFAPLGRALIHGDLHPGNALIRAEDPEAAPVLLDWGRARVGSPLEDVCSFLQSLGGWEPEVRRRHDTLLVGYLRARGQTGELRRALRDAYWLAGASNALAGALRYHVFQACDAAAGERETAIHCAREWLRVVRRADACWSAGGG